VCHEVWQQNNATPTRASTSAAFSCCGLAVSFAKLRIDGTEVPWQLDSVAARMRRISVNQNCFLMPHTHLLASKSTVCNCNINKSLFPVTGAYLLHHLSLVFLTKSNTPHPELPLASHRTPN